ncbi:MAG: Flp pilus assembly protein CpaB [Anaerolinea sp.]
MKKFLPIVLAMVVFGVALALNQPEPQVAVVVAAADLPEGKVLSETDLTVKELPGSLAPQGAVSDIQSLVGQRLRVARSAGDPILPAHLGGEALELQPNERAVALSVSASQGLAGLLKPGDRVGVTVIVTVNQQTFAKYLAGGLRVLWVDPTFKREETAASPQGTPQAPGGLFGGGSSAPVDTGGAAKGLVVLAVPVEAQTLVYDFDLLGAVNESKPLYLVDVLPALSAQNNVQFGLVLEPEKAQEVRTSGMTLQGLAVTPMATHTPTPTGQPAAQVEATPQPTKKP